MQIDQNAKYPLNISHKFFEIVQQQIKDVNADNCGFISVSFRDPDYSAERGGFHPVEVGIDRNGKIQYITDFAYFGSGPFVELDKAMDFDFSTGRYRDHLSEVSITKVRELFEMFQKNFCSYFEMGVFNVTVC
jgi:hypothetical protein